MDDDRHIYIGLAVFILEIHDDESYRRSLNALMSSFVFNRRFVIDKKIFLSIRSLTGFMFSIDVSRPGDYHEVSEENNTETCFHINHD